MDTKIPQINEPINTTSEPFRQPSPQPPEPKQSLWERRPQALAGDDPPPMYPAEAYSQSQNSTQQQNVPQYQQQQQPKAFSQQDMGYGVQGHQGHQDQPGQTVVYVQGKDRRAEDVGVGFCAGCCAACCCCGCVVM
ncbi:hypothetical protein HYFRA_00001484 [Hymenoscyphus fraxineus]|uniref:Cysteine-rich transmembrane domain-containing protein n=1 Tax=Hymenoscyphus fraxineus TaxID=746836 RepID=A0A9N9L8Q7_9HELO|nr:hypothetical protein HYFRA_00001484 [Hymenoscyphus fraxineus]